MSTRTPEEDKLREKFYAGECWTCAKQGTRVSESSWETTCPIPQDKRWHYVVLPEVTKRLGALVCAECIEKYRDYNELGFAYQMWYSTIWCDD